jgi:hypothetical protein
VLRPTALRGQCLCLRAPGGWASIKCSGQLTEEEHVARTPQEVFQHHAEALGAEDVDAIVEDYADGAIAAVLLTLWFVVPLSRYLLGR